MRVYPDQPSFCAGQSITICVQPGSTFKLAFFRQDKEEALVPVPFPRVTLDGLRKVVQLGGGADNPFFRSEPDPSPKDWKNGWNWPSVTCDIPNWPADVYVAAIYPVDTQGNPETDIGRAFARGENIVPVPPASVSMALVVLMPARPVPAHIAYILPVATYHAYNGAGGGGFYRGSPGWYPEVDKPQHSTVTLQRPGGGLGAGAGYLADRDDLLREPPDAYDATSPRQQFAHWDAKFIRWLKSRGLGIDFYTDMDLDSPANPLLSGSRRLYSLLLSAGHHEYWSEGMYENVQAYLHAGGNYAVFSGNTCWWKVSFGRRAGPFTEFTTVQKGPHWDEGAEKYLESRLTGLSYGFGGGKWGKSPNDDGHWVETDRQALGYTLKPGMEKRWVFSNTDLPPGKSFGESDHLVGYECDGQPVSRPSKYPPFELLAQSSPLDDTWDKEGYIGVHQAGIVLYDPTPAASDRRGVVFNCGTTDWARVLMDSSAQAYKVVNQITLNVVQTLSRSHLQTVRFSASELQGKLKDVAARVNLTLVMHSGFGAQMIDASDQGRGIALGATKDVSIENLSKRDANLSEALLTQLEPRGALVQPTYENLCKAIAPRISPDEPTLLANRKIYPVGTLRFLAQFGVSLSGFVHREGQGDVSFESDRFSGIRDQGHCLAGFQIQFDPPVPGLVMRYMAYLQDIGEVPWVDAGQFIGTRGESRRLEGFAIELTGPLAVNYTVRYRAHLQDLGGTGFCRDGEFCGTRGRGKRVQGMEVHVGPR